MFFKWLLTVSGTVIISWPRAAVKENITEIHELRKLGNLCSRDCLCVLGPEGKDFLHLFCLYFAGNEMKVQRLISSVYS